MKKDDLRTPDAFIATSNSFLHFIERHAMPIFSTLGLVIVLSLSYLAYSYWTGYQEKKAASHIYEAEAELRQAQKKGDTARPQDPTKPQNFEADLLPHVSRLLTALQDVHQTKAALLSAMGLVDMLADSGQWKLAEDEIGRAHV